MVVTRFAPSPTGYLHIGGLRTALYSYLWARKNDGVFRLRIEDTDMARNSQEALDAIIEAFNWVGLSYDKEVEYQSKRMDIYKEYIEKLLESENAYKCYMSKDELDSLRASQEAAKQTPRYDGTWRPEAGKVLPAIPEGVEPVIRIKAPKDGEIRFYDGVKGDMKFDASFVDDFVIARSSGVPTYNFVVTIDDMLMEISDVIRGDDHLSNTPKQIVIYNALGVKHPNFYHVPMINNPEGKKLSKRDGAMDVMDYKRLGYMPEALLNFLVRLGWSNKDQEIFSINEMLELFDPKNINKSASAYNAEKLLWLNSEYIKNASNDRLAEELKFFDFDLSSYPKKDEILNLSKQRANTLIELKNSILLILNDVVSYEEAGVNKFIKDDSYAILSDYLALLEKNQDSFSSVEALESLTKPFISEKNLKFPQIFQPIRLALTGSTQAPSVYDILFILGFAETKERISKALEKKFKNS